MNSACGENTVILQDSTSGGDVRWLRFQQPARVLCAADIEDVLPALREVACAVEAGRWAAGYIAYEAARAFDGAFVTHAPGVLPLLWFGLYDEPVQADPPRTRCGAGSMPAEWTPALDAVEYAAAIARIKRYLHAGDTYQVNYTMRLRTRFDGDGSALFALLCRAQPTGNAAFLDMGRYVICSASPELFFALRGNRLWTRPMKGTASRGLTVAEDDRRALALVRSEKNRAENIMIVDMIRNDLGRVARAGTVQAVRLCDVERYRTVVQMTSRVECRTDAGLVPILSALFPCASITGAPKIRTMQIIRELEPEPRGVYTGCIGFVGPGRTAQFNVAIRTVVWDRSEGRAEYGVGGGIVWDSESADEYRECGTKAALLTAAWPEFDLLETLLWEPSSGYFLLDPHVTRLALSAGYFGRPFEGRSARTALRELADSFVAEPRRVRMRVRADGRLTLESGALPGPAACAPWAIALAREPVDTSDPFLYHKTTNRLVYEGARKGRPAHDEVVLWNERGELTEGTIANLVIEIEGRLWTPPVSSGLLDGVFRQWLIREGRIHERVLVREDLERAVKIYLVNSLRKWIPAELRNDL